MRRALCSAGLLAVLACFVLTDRACAQQRGVSMFAPGFQVHFAYNTMQGLPTQQGQLGGGFGAPFGGFNYASPFGYPYAFPPPFQAARMARQQYLQNMVMQGMMMQQLVSDPGFGWYDPNSTSSFGVSGSSTSSASFKSPGSFTTPFTVNPGFGAGFQSD